MLYLYEVQNLYNDICDFEISPSETVELLHIRSEFQEVYDRLTDKEKQILQQCDQKMIDNCTFLFNHLQQGYNFPCTNKPTSEWWWHLDKIVSGELIVSIEINRIT